MLALPENTNTGSLDTAPLHVLFDEPFPRSGPAMLNFENRVFTVSTRVGDAITRVQIERAHRDPSFVAEAVARARQHSPVPLRHKGTRTTSVLLLGGTRLLVSTPYL